MCVCVCVCADDEVIGCLALFAQTEPAGPHAAAAQPSKVRPAA